MRRIQNYTPTSYANQRRVAAGTKRKRTGSRLSCNECRRQKIKCDRGHPCEGCLKMGVACGYDEEAEEEWRYVEKRRPGLVNGHSNGHSNANRTPNGRGEEKATSIDQRMEKLENLVERLAAKVDKLDSKTPVTAQNSPSSLVSNTKSVVVRRREATLEQGVPNGNDSVFVGINHQHGFVMAIRQGVPFFIGTTGWCVNHYAFEECGIMFKWPKTFGREWALYGELKSRFKGWRQPSFLDALPLLTPAPPSEEDLMALIPARAVCTVLINRFLSTLNYPYPVVEAQSLWTDMDEFWRTNSPKSSSWLAHLVAILGIGYQLPVLPFPDGIEVPNGAVLGKEIITKVTQFVYTSASMLRRPDTVTFQTFLLLVVVQKLYMEHPDGSDAIAGLLSITGKLAFSMGLHRDPAMALYMPAAEISLRRKLWTTYVFCDFEHSLNTGMPFTLRFSDYDTVDPEELDDSLLIRGSTLSPVPIRGITYMIFELDARLRKVNVHPWMTPETDGLEKANVIGKAVRQAILDCINLRLRSLINHGMLDKSDPVFRRHALEVFLNSAIGMLKHQDYIMSLVDEADPSTQRAWSHYVLSILRYVFFSACKDILFLIRQCKNGCIPIPGGTNLKLDTDRLFGALESQESNFKHVLPFSMSCIKEQVIFSGLKEGVRERLRIYRDFNKSSIDMNAEEAKPIIQAMQRGMEQAVRTAREAIDKVATQPDPPPGLAAWIAEKAAPATATAAAINNTQQAPSAKMDLEIPIDEEIDWAAAGEDMMPMSTWMPDLPELPWPFSDTNAQDPGW